MADEPPAKKGLPKRGALVSVRLDGVTPPRPHQYAPPDWPAPLRALAKVSQFLAVLEGIGIGFCLLAVVFLAVWQFVERNLVMGLRWSFPSPPDWSHGVIRHSVFLLGFLGGAYATYTGRHIRIDAVTRVLKPRKRMILRVVTTLAALGIVSLFVYAGIGFREVTLIETGEASQAGELFTPARGAMIMIIGYATIAFHFLVQLILDIAWLVSGKTPPPEWISEASHGGDVANLGDAAEAPAAGEPS